MPFLYGGNRQGTGSPSYQASKRAMTSFDTVKRTFIGILSIRRVEDLKMTVVEQPTTTIASQVSRQK